MISIVMYKTRQFPIELRIDTCSLNIDSIHWTCEINLFWIHRNSTTEKKIVPIIMQSNFLFICDGWCLNSWKIYTKKKIPENSTKPSSRKKNALIWASKQIDNSPKKCSNINMDDSFEKPNSSKLSCADWHSFEVVNISLMWCYRCGAVCLKYLCVYVSAIWDVIFHFSCSSFFPTPTSQLFLNQKST